MDYDSTSSCRGRIIRNFRKPLYVLSFDEDTAMTAGLPVRLMTNLFTIITGVVIAVMMPIAGSLLVSAVIVLPASIALRVSSKFNGVIIGGIIISLIGFFCRTFPLPIFTKHLREPRLHVCSL